MNDRSLDIPDPIERANLVAFVDRALRLNEAAVIRLKARPDGLVAAWAATGFDVLAVRVIDATLRPSDTTVAADVVLASLRSGPPIDLGYSMDSSWRTALPPDSGFVHLEDVPASVLLDLAQRGAELAKDHGSAHGPPSSLLDQEVLEVHGPGEQFGVPMRVVFALTAMGFVPDNPGEKVRVRATKAWVRLDARYGSVTRHRTGGLKLSV
ncbi:hypothetical protein [Antrihabitans sp. YC2-6]|uniref:hypothetical protein n=1 Tax=Antrihabitans sp. YC2-6 TaxID=2799498 RepID=UPI0018F76B74|nr:hypothetical protein [Antrihabitans sp. YC2-6]MBJ8346761.1 hypothetical protein [Antrihabitans sp. YC2-6]